MGASCVETSYDPDTCECTYAPIECDDGNDCTSDSCNPITNECVYVAVQDGTFCDDGDECTFLDICQGGECTPGAKAECGTFLNGSLDGFGAGLFKTYSCSAHDYPGPELIYKFTPNCAGQVSVTLSTGNIWKDDDPEDPPIKLGPIDILVLDSNQGCDSEACIAAGLMKMQGPIGGGTAVATFPGEKEHDYYVVADGRDNSGGNFTLLVNCVCNLFQ